MIGLDINVLVAAHRPEHVDHSRAKAWLERTLGSGQTVVVFDLVASGFLRVVTSARVFNSPTSLAEALSALAQLRAQPAVLSLSAGPRHPEIFEACCVEADARGNLVTDAHLASLAIEHNCAWASFDRDFARFKSLRWILP
ncbi:MAG: type II toxin-antitoxin system VapC family toxin [Deltaproteobacteria bacterium]|nr:type II toxin-antitoxin system VapC family toxin [Deltaproteobacteria bacterium]